MAINDHEAAGYGAAGVAVDRRDTDAAEWDGRFRARTRTGDGRWKTAAKRADHSCTSRHAIRIARRLSWFPIHRLKNPSEYRIAKFVEVDTEVGCW
jgi:hypothetical protein